MHSQRRNTQEPRNGRCTTLTNIRSGYAEMLKHGLISTAEHWNELIGFDLENPDIATLRNMVGTSVEVKEKIVEGICVIHLEKDCIV